MCIIVLSLCTLCLQCWCLPVKKKITSCAPLKIFFKSYIGLCVKKMLKLTKTRIQYFLTHIYANFQYVVTQEM